VDLPTFAAGWAAAARREVAEGVAIGMGFVDKNGTVRSSYHPFTEQDLSTWCRTTSSGSCHPTMTLSFLSGERWETNHDADVPSES
jgi:hypothetical protein